MKKLVWLLLALVVCIIPAGAAVTEEDIHNVGGDALADAVPAGQRDYLEGIRPETADELAGSFAQLLENVSEDSRSALHSAVQSLAQVAVVVVITAAARGFSSAAGGEADALIDQLLGMENPYACPHGRPTIVSMSKYDLEKKFKRIV